MTRIEQLDAWLFEAVNRGFTPGWLDNVMVFASSKYGWIPLYAFLVVLFFVKFPVKKAVVCILLLVAAFGISDSFTSRVIKPFFKRPRPYTIENLHVRLPLIKNGNTAQFVQDNRKNYGFVSSHSSNFFALATLSVLLLGWKGRSRMALYAIAALVALSRVYLGVHYPGDVIGGAFAGTGIALAIAYAYRKLLEPKL